MKATLEFSLPEEKTWFDDAVHGSDWRGVVQDFFEWMHAQESRHTFDLDELRTELLKLVEDNGLDVW